MTTLSAASITLQAHAGDRDDAIRQVGLLLVRGGCVDLPYIDGMLTRERIMSTYLGSGVAIPHGCEENRKQVKRTGIAVLQLPRGVEWEAGEMAHLVVAIAADSNDHMGVLANLAEVMEDPGLLQQLIRATDPHVVARLLSRSHENP